MRYRYFSRVVAPLFLLCMLAAGAELVECEYFFDIDPGLGNGTAVALPAAAEVDFAFDVPTAGLSEGWHSLFVRVLDDGSMWSHYEGIRFYINTEVTFPPETMLTGVEYFFDTDPGLGNGLTMAVGNTNEIDVEHAVPATGLDPGWHTLFARVRNEAGEWSLFQAQRFYIHGPPDPLPATELVQLEFFVDVEPGVGSGTSVPITAGPTLDDTVELDMTGVAEGTHTVYLRVLDGRGGWSFREAGTFEVVDTAFHWVTFTADTHGTIEGTAVQHVQDGTASMAVTAVPECDCYVFSGWIGDYVGGSEENPLVIPNVTGPLDVTATFELLYIYDQDDLDEAVANAPGPDRDGDGVTDEVEIAQGTDPDSYIVVLEPGWNLISFARIPADNSTAAMFQGAIEGPAWGWNAGRRSYYPETNVSPTRGLWVYVFQRVTIEVIVPDTVVVTNPAPPP